MSDQCRTCTVRGDLKKCLATECGHHENWFEKELLSQISALKAQMNATALACVDACVKAYRVGKIYVNDMPDFANDWLQQEASK